MTNSDEIEEERFRLEFYARRSVRYHDRRMSFFGKLNKSFTALNLIFGSATVIALLKLHSEKFVLATAAAVTVFSAIDLIIGTGQKIWQHNDLKRRFLLIESKLVKKM